MTDQDWDRVVELLAQNWPHQLHPDHTLEKMREKDLNGFPVEQILAAIETLYRDGREWPPLGGVILGRLADLTFDFPQWHDALRAIRRALCKTSDLIVEDDSEKGWHYEDERITWLEKAEPFAALFVKALDIGRLKLEDGNDEARLRDKYRDFCRRARETVLYRGLPAAGLTRLEAIAEPGRVISIPGEGPRLIETERPAGRKLSFAAAAAQGREAA